MNKKSIKDLRIMLTVNFMAEIIGIITLYLSDIHSIKFLSINILSLLYAILSVIGLLLILKLLKNKNKEKIILLSSLVIEIFVIILSIFIRMNRIPIYLQVLSDILKFLCILNLYKDLKKSKKKKEKLKNIMIITIISYIISKISYILLNLSSGINLRPILTTISILGVSLVYTLYIKELEKR